MIVPPCLLFSERGTHCTVASLPPLLVPANGYSSHEGADVSCGREHRPTCLMDAMYNTLNLLI